VLLPILARCVNATSMTSVYLSGMLVHCDTDTLMSWLPAYSEANPDRRYPVSTFGPSFSAEEDQRGTEKVEFCTSAASSASHIAHAEFLVRTGISVTENVMDKITRSGLRHKNYNKLRSGSHLSSTFHGPPRPT